MRDRLIGIVKSSLMMHIGKSCNLAENIVDDLLNENVIVPPCKLNQTLWRAVSTVCGVQECKVSSLTQKADGSFKIRITVLEYRGVCEITPDEIGKTVFLTREEAEQALKGGADNGHP